jgi:hypothetical protein
MVQEVLDVMRARHRRHDHDRRHARWALREVADRVLFDQDDRTTPPEASLVTPPTTASAHS